MSEKPERFTLSRWSRRKLDAASAPVAAPATAAASTAPAPATPAPSAVPPELPSVESLGFDSDFTAFLRPEVDEKLKRAALKQLFRDPRFNVMDGLDVYIDDYTKADPIPPDMLKDLLQRFVVAKPEPEAAEAQAANAEPVPSALPAQPAAQLEAASPPPEPAAADEAVPPASSVPGPAADSKT
jgi:hypothetical protein